eukprot:TRINITY_DN26725_c0_g2_i1.p1 TRINITY_DN26725_c0_g2~~TRINITY_DN26725_c0_g2_i1.p1  ORF type:complete len:799 (-),score=130.73 TRINITY_DN26725_c0_g2_i1:326-2722(-)
MDSLSDVPGRHAVSLPALRVPTPKQIATAAKLYTSDSTAAAVHHHLPPRRRLAARATGVAGAACQESWQVAGGSAGDRCTADFFRCMDTRGRRDRGTSGGSVRAKARRATGCTCSDTDSRNGSDLGPCQQSIAPSRSVRGNPRRAHMRALKAVYLGEDAIVNDSRIDDALAASEAAALEENIELRVRRDVALVKTGEDAIKFFTKYGGSASVKVMYFVRSSSGPGEPEPGPYDLVVASQECARGEHFTISSSGVMHFCPGQLSNCLPLSEWMQESIVYRVLTSMSFFRYAPHRKIISEWRSNARYSAYYRRRQQLARRSFFAKPLFAKPLLHAHRLACDLDNVKLLRLPDIACELDDFVEAQCVALSDPVCGAQRELLKQHDALVGVLENLIDSVKRASQEAVKAASQPTSTCGRPVSMVQEKREARELAHRRRVAQEDEALLDSCIRWAEEVRRGAFVTHLHDAAQQLARRVDGVQNELQRKMFVMRPEVFEDELRVAPLPEQFIAALDRTMAGTIDAIDAVPMLCSTRSLSTCGSPPKWPEDEAKHGRTVSEILACDRSWVDLIGSLRRNISYQAREAFMIAREIYEPCRCIWRHGQVWDESAYLTAERHRDVVMGDMNTMSRFKDTLGSIRAQKVVGVMFLDGTNLLKQFEPMIRNSVMTMEQKLCSIARLECVALSKRLESNIKRLDERPKDTTMLPQYVEAYYSARKEQESIERAADAIRNMYCFLEKQRVRIPMEDELHAENVYTKERELTDRAVPEAGLHIERLQNQQHAGAPMTLAFQPTIQTSSFEAVW